MDTKSKIIVNTPVVAAPESLINVLGVVYVHCKASDGGDMYITRFGMPVADLLEIDNWYEREWFHAHRERLEGTSSVYRVPTREINGRSIELVVKNCRVGEDVPLETRTLLEFINTEFNSPWEEFALVMEMREGVYGPGDLNIRTQEPLAIYVPPERMQPWQIGRSKSKINRIKARHPGIDLDILRQYKLIYGWIKGKNAVEAFEHIGLKGKSLEKKLAPITRRVIDDLEKKGYVVADMKPAHIIIDEKDTIEIDGLGRSAGGERIKEQSEYLHNTVDKGDYSVIDYELLIRTPPHEEEVKYSRRHSYLFDQRDRFVATEMPSHLRQMEIFGVPYIFGHAESTDGRLWVVGRNARLFDYFLPERWRNTHGWKLSENNEVFYSLTKDNVHIVWKTSRVGERPSPDTDGETGSGVETKGINSPFEEFAIVDYLNRNGVPTVYTRAIYMTGSVKMEQSSDMSRYESHKSITCYDGSPVLREDHNYITIRGYYNGPDGWVAQQEGKLFRPIDMVSALANRVISKTDYYAIFNATLERLKNIGIDGSRLKGNDMLLAFDPDLNLVIGGDKRPEVRICNFEMLYKI